MSFIIYNLVCTSCRSQYIRMAKDYEKADSIKKMETVFKQFWKLAEPGTCYKACLWG